MNNKQLKAREMLEQLCVFNDIWTVTLQDGSHVINFEGYLTIKVRIHEDVILVNTGGEEDLLEGWFKVMVGEINLIAKDCGLDVKMEVL
jgi:hypothetical protein